MAEIAPFSAFLFNPKVDSVSKLVSLPYDKIPDPLREVYLQKSPYNIVRIIRPKPPTAESPADSQYGEAARYFSEWKKNSTLLKDPQPAFYPYHQEYTVPGQNIIKTRKGMVALVKLRRFGEGVFPHENTFPGPKMDRFKLLRATEANFGQIFMLYSDPQHKIKALLEEEIKTEPHFNLDMEDLKERHKLWRISNQEVIHKLKNAFESLPLYVADGHHRYETSLAFYEEKKQKGLSEKELEPYSYCMATLVNMDSDGLTILPTHRALRLSSRISPEEARNRLSSLFDIHILEGTGSLSERTKEWLGERTMPRFALLLGGQLLGLQLSNYSKLAAYHLPEVYQDVEVVILHDVLLRHLFSLNLDQKDEGEVIGYFREMEKVEEKIQQKEYDMAFLLPSIPMEQFRRVTQAGYRLPQKSTDFYPKMLSGLAIYSMKE